MNKLRSAQRPFVVKFIWEGNGGIIINESDLDLILKNKNVAKSNGDYKIHLSDFVGRLYEKWYNKLTVKKGFHKNK